MLVYRICDDKEMSLILSERSFNSIGKEYEINSKLNNHQYNKNTKYLHFFKEYSDVFYLSSSDKTYICIFDIPDDILLRYKGIGKYLDRLLFEKLEQVEEYAIPSELILFDYLVSVDKISKDLLFEEFLANDCRDKLTKGYIDSLILKNNQHKS